MLHIALKSEYSFGKTYGFLGKLHDEYSVNKVIGIADFNTFSVFKLKKLCEKSGVKPIFGYRVNVVKDATEKVKPRGQFGKEYVILAKNIIGLKEIYVLTKINSTNFYYRGNISISDINNLSNNVIVISTDPITKRLDYIGVNFLTRQKVLDYDFPKVYIDNNYYSEQKDEAVYQLYAERNAENKTYAQYILKEEEVLKHFGQECIDNTYNIAEQIEVFDLPTAHNIVYEGKSDIITDCKRGAVRLGLDLEKDPYKSRFEREINLIKDKGFTDYLMIVAEILKKAKEICFIGPGRGSSAGSLVCYLLDITKIDPIIHGLIFERFIDVNRFDSPDVDSDIPDNAKARVVRQIEKRYGIDSVKTISNITKLMPKSAIGIFAKGMDIPAFETEEVKDVIISRAQGDARASFCLEDTLKGTEVGREFLEAYPEMECVKYIEGHAKNKGKHAAGVIVCNEDLTNYCGIDERDQTVYLDKKDAEALNLLKIDILGLRTLAVLENFSKLVGFDYNDFYTLPLDDEKAYTVFKERRLAGVFQFEGDAMASINDSIPMENFADISACAALGRPGALSSGGTSRYIQLRNGDREPLYYCDEHKKITEETYGIIVFQESMMFALKDIGSLSWEDVSTLRRAASKSLGDEFFDKFKKKFVDGAIEKSGYDEKTATKAWLDISSMGSYAFNKSHSVAYGLISYWCIHGQSKLFDWDSGEYITIANAFKKNIFFGDKFDFNIACYDENSKKTISGKVKKIIRTTGAKNIGLKKAIKIKLKNRRKLICSHEHKILTDKGYVKAIELSIGDKVFCEKLNGAMYFTEETKEKLSKASIKQWESEEHRENAKKGDWFKKGHDAMIKKHGHYCDYNHMSTEEQIKHKENFIKNIQPKAAKANVGRKMFTMNNGKKTPSFFEYVFEGALVKLNINYEWQKKVPNGKYSYETQFGDFYVNGIFIELEINKRNEDYYIDKYDNGNIPYIIIKKDSNINEELEIFITATEIKNGNEIVLSEIVDITPYKDSVMYDVVMENEPHNYLADNIVVHNCAWAKAHHPLEFIAANLNNAKDDESSLKILREFYEKEHLEYEPVDPYNSDLYWTISDGKLIGGLTNMKGIGVQKAKDIIKIRKGLKDSTPAMQHKMDFPETPFDILYPILHRYGDIYDKASEYGLENVTTINKIIEGMGRISVIGTMITCDDNDANDVQSVAKRGGEILDGPHMKIHMRLEDDSGVVMCILGRYKYEKMSQTLLRAKVGKTDFAIVGKVLSGAKIIMIEKIANLSVQMPKNDEKEDRKCITYRGRVMKVFGLES